MIITGERVCADDRAGPGEPSGDANETESSNTPPAMMHEMHAENALSPQIIIILRRAGSAEIKRQPTSAQTMPSRGAKLAQQSCAASRRRIAAESPLFCTRFVSFPHAIAIRVINRFESPFPSSSLHKSIAIAACAFFGFDTVCICRPAVPSLQLNAE